MSSPKRRGPPRRGYVCLGEPEDRKCGLSSSPFARLCEAFARLGEGRLRIGEHVTV